MARNWRYYHEVPREGEESLYVKMGRISSIENPDITSIHNGQGNVSTYRVLDAIVFVRNTKSLLRTHTFTVETDKQIDAARSKLKELTGVGLLLKVG